MTCIESFKSWYRLGCFGLLAGLWWMAPAVALAQDGEATIQTDASRIDLANPLSLIDQVARTVDALSVGAAAQSNQGIGGETVGVNPGMSLGVEAGENAGGLSGTLSILALLTVLSIAPSMVVMMTCFTRIVVVLALLRQAVGTQSLPPSQVLTGLALFMTFLVMAPTFQQVNSRAIVPLQEQKIDAIEAWGKAKEPLRRFMLDQIDFSENWDNVYLILDYRGVDTTQTERLTEADVDMLTLIPAFILSELKVAFLMGFRLYLPFLIVDMVVASILISMGMPMLPPVLISLPFKLLLFVLVDGWHLVAGNLLSSFAVPGITI